MTDIQQRAIIFFYTGREAQQSLLHDVAKELAEQNNMPIRNVTVCELTTTDLANTVLRDIMTEINSQQIDEKSKELQKAINIVNAELTRFVQRNETFTTLEIITIIARRCTESRRMRNAIRVIANTKEEDLVKEIEKSNDLLPFFAHIVKLIQSHKALLLN